MYYNHQLRVNIQEWRNRFLKSDINYCNNSFNYLLEKLQKEAFINTILIDLESHHPYSSKDFIKRFENKTFETEEQLAAYNYQLCKWVKGRKNRNLESL